LPDRHVFRDGLLILARPIRLDDEHVGTICIAGSLGPVHAQLRHGIIIMVGIILVASLGAYLLSSRLQGAISSPILSLACLANFVSEKKQYTVRAEPHGSDEVGLLVQAFNEMLEQIQQRGSALVEANEQLEGRVAERTMELTAANEKLLREVAFRKRAEQVLKQRASGSCTIRERSSS
jgi:nitrate/nitrite-specific signal transduction histidine kinase